MRTLCGCVAPTPLHMSPWRATPPRQCARLQLPESLAIAHESILAGKHHLVQALRDVDNLPHAGRTGSALGINVGTGSGAWGGWVVHEGVALER